MQKQKFLAVICGADVQAEAGDLDTNMNDFFKSHFCEQLKSKNVTTKRRALHIVYMPIFKATF